MFIENKQLENILAQNAIYIKLWLIAKLQNITILEIKPKLASQFGITKDTLYKYRNEAMKVITQIEADYPEEDYDLDAIEQAAAKEAQISMKSSWQDKFKSIDLRSDRLKKTEKGLNIENDEPISTKPKPKFTPIDIGAIESDNYTQFDDVAELDKLEQEQKRKRSMLSYI